MTQSATHTQTRINVRVVIVVNNLLAGKKEKRNETKLNTWAATALSGWRKGLCRGCAETTLKTMTNFATPLLSRTHAYALTSFRREREQLRERAAVLPAVNANASASRRININWQRYLIGST